MKLQGIFSSLATPFDHTGGLYKIKVQYNVERWNLTALAGYVVGGLTGEGVGLMFDEKVKLWEWVAQYAAREKLLVAAASAESVRETVELSNRAHDLGYKAALIRPTRYSDAHAVYFRAVADQSKLPVIIHNAPAIDIVAELSQHPNILASVESAAVTAQVIRESKAGLQVLSGSAQTLADSFAAGATAGILAFANAAPYAAISIWEAH